MCFGLPVLTLQTRLGSELSDTNQSVCGAILTLLSIAVAACTFPISLFFCIKVVQEYERAVIFRLVWLLGVTLSFNSM